RWLKHHRRTSHHEDLQVSRLSRSPRVCKGEHAEEQRHNSDIFLAWGKVGITTWTYKINGQTESDFILAANIEQLPKSLLPPTQHQTPLPKSTPRALFI